MPDGAVSIVLRRSAIEAAGECLFRYNKIWNEGVPEQSDPALRGIAFHACAHRYISRLVEKRLQMDSEEAALGFAEGIASVEDFPARLIVECRELYDRWAERFALNLNEYLTSEEHQDRSEQMFTPDLVYARSDCLEIIDFKTFWVGLTEAQAKDDWQARWYVRNAMIQWPHFPRYRFTYHFIRINHTLSVEFEPHELDTLQREIEAVQGRILEAHRTGNWSATPGPACSYCVLRCPVVDRLETVPKRLTTIQAQEVATKLVAADQLVKLAKKALKAYCATNGPIDVGGIRWDNRPSVSRTYPVDAILEAFKKLKIDRQAGDVLAAGGDLTISASALKKVMRLYPDLEPILQASERQKTTFRFGAKAAGDVEEEED